MRRGELQRGQAMQCVGGAYRGLRGSLAGAGQRWSSSYGSPSALRRHSDAADTRESCLTQRRCAARALAMQSHAYRCKASVCGGWSRFGTVQHTGDRETAAAQHTVKATELAVREGEQMQAQDTCKSQRKHTIACTMKFTIDARGKRIEQVICVVDCALPPSVRHCCGAAALVRVCRRAPCTRASVLIAASRCGCVYACVQHAMAASAASPGVPACCKAYAEALDRDIASQGARPPPPHQRAQYERDRFFAALHADPQQTAAGAAAAIGIPKRTGQGWAHDSLAHSARERDRHVADLPLCAAANGKGESHPARLFSDAQEQSLAALAVRRGFSRNQLCETAQLLYALTHPSAPKPVFSDRFVFDFTQRTGISFGAGRERPPVNVHASALHFWAQILSTARSFVPQRVGTYLNIDEVRVNTEVAPHHVAAYLFERTDLTPGFECHPASHARTAVTFLIATTLAGALFVGCVLAGEKQWKDGGSVYDGVWVLYNKTGYVDTGAFLAFVDYVLARVPEPAILIADAARYHATQIVRELLEAYGARAVDVPEQTTGALQPLDVSVFAPLKRCFAHFYDLLQGGGRFGNLRTTRNLHRLIISAMDLSVARMRCLPHVLLTGWRHSGLLRVIAPELEPCDLVIPLASFQGNSVSTREVLAKGKLLERDQLYVNAICAPLLLDDNVLLHVTNSLLSDAFGGDSRCMGKPPLRLTPAQELQQFRALAIAEKDANSVESTYVSNNNELQWPEALGTTPTTCESLANSSARDCVACVGVQRRGQLRSLIRSERHWGVRSGANRSAPQVISARMRSPKSHPKAATLLRR